MITIGTQYLQWYLVMIGSFELLIKSLTTVTMFFTIPVPVNPVDVLYVEQRQIELNPPGKVLFSNDHHSLYTEGKEGRQSLIGSCVSFMNDFLLFLYFSLS